MIHVLIVDDEPIMRNFLKNILDWEACGLHLSGVVSDGLKAMDIIRREKIHIVLTDVKMPHMNGIELMEAALAHDPEIRFIILSGFDDFYYVNQAYKLGVQDYFLKAELSVDDLKSTFLKLASELSKQDADGAGMVRAGDAEYLLYKNRFVLKQNALRDLVFGHDRQAAMRSLDGLGIFIDSSALRVMVIQVHIYTHILSSQWNGDRELFKFAVTNVLQEILDEHNAGQVFANTVDEFILLLTSPADSDAVFAELRAALRTHFGLNLCGGQSRTASGFAAVRELYQQAAKACQNYFYKGKNLLLSPEDIQNGDAAQQPVGLGNKAALLRELLTIINRSNVLLYLGKLTVDSGYRDAEAVRKLFDIYEYELESFCARNDLTAAIQPQFLLYTGELKEYGDLSDLNQWLKKTLLTITNAAEQGSDIVAQVQSYVAGHYMEDISLTELACYFGVNSAHLSRIFHRESGISFIKYLTNFRMEKAVELIGNTSMKIYEIAERVGYANVEHFSRCFKKHTGVSPNQYLKERRNSGS